MVHSIDVAIIVVYLAGMVLIGFIASKKIKDSEDYLVAGRGLGLGMYFPCMAALLLGGGSNIAVARLGYKFGVSGAMYVWMFGLGVLLMGFFLSTKLTHLKVLSLTQLLGIRFGKSSRIVSSVIMVVYLVSICALQIISIGTITHVLLGWDLTIAMLVGASIAIFYSMSLT